MSDLHPQALLSRSSPLRSTFTVPLCCSLAAAPPSETPPSLEGAAPSAQLKSLALKLPFRGRMQGDLMARRKVKGIIRLGGEEGDVQRQLACRCSHPLWDRTTLVSYISNSLPHQSAPSLPARTAPLGRGWDTPAGDAAGGSREALAIGSSAILSSLSQQEMLKEAGQEC